VGSQKLGFTALVGSKNGAAHRASVPIAPERSADLPLLA